VWGYLRRAGELAKANHEARDMFGRRRSLPDPTTERCRDFFIEENEETLRLDEEIQAANILKFKMTNLRPPNEEEEYNLTHRNPTEKEVASAWRALTGRIGRQGKNHEIQGTNASIIKRAMGCGFDKNGTPYLWHTLPQFKARIQSMVHDELILHCPLIYAEQVAALVGDAFKRAAAEVMGSVVIMENDYHISHRWQK
jgi:DNA polymerase I-like protein with 3'-5' exonuclease and polymerase domains